MAAAQSSTGQSASVLARVDDNRAVDDDVVNTHWKLLGLGACRRRANAQRVEDDYIGLETVAQQPAVGKSEPLGWERGHLPDRLRQRELALVAGELPQYQRKTTICTRARKLADQHCITANHGQRVRDELRQAARIAAQSSVRRLQVFLHQEVAQRIDRMLVAHR